MTNLTNYLNTITPQLHKEGRRRESKVEKMVYELVVRLVESNQPSTIKAISTKLNKRVQHIHQVVKRSERLRKEKVKGWTIVLPKDLK